MQHSVIKSTVITVTNIARLPNLNCIISEMTHVCEDHGKAALRHPSMVKRRRACQRRAEADEGTGGVVKTIGTSAKVPDSSFLCKYFYFRHSGESRNPLSGLRDSG